MKYKVMVREVHVSHHCIEADTEQKAIDIAYNDLTLYNTDIEYSHCLSKEHCTVEEWKD